MDNAHTPNFRVKTCLLEYMKDLILMMSPDLIANPSNEVINAIGKIISWSAEPKSADVRRVSTVDLLLYNVFVYIVILHHRVLF